MTKLTVLSPITHDDKDYKPGDKFEGKDEVVRPLIEAGALEDPNRPKSTVEASEIEDAKTRGDEIVKAAEQELADAKTEAERLVAEARAEADEIKRTAKKMRTRRPLTPRLKQSARSKMRRTLL